MDASLYVTSPGVRLPDSGAPPAGDLNELLRQVVAAQRDQIALLKSQQGHLFEMFRDQAAVLKAQHAQIVDIQRDQLAVLKAQQAAQDGLARWKAFLARWQDEFPGAGPDCKRVLPLVERAYLALVQEVTDKLQEEPGLDNEFALNEFLDRYGVRLAQLGSVLSQLGPLADAAPPI